jgi:hypothetical protein
LDKKAILAEFNQWKSCTWSVPEPVNYPHNIPFNSVPTFLKEDSCEAIGARSLV